MSEETAEERRAAAAADPYRWRVGGSPGTHGHTLYQGTELAAVYLDPGRCRRAVAYLNMVEIIAGRLPLPVEGEDGPSPVDPALPTRARWLSAEARVAELEAAMREIMRVTDPYDEGHQGPRSAVIADGLYPARRIARQALGLPLGGS